MDTSQAFLRKSRDLLAEYLEKIDRSLEPLADSDVWWRANDRSNSIGNLILHLCGNVTQWIVGGVGRRPYERLRQQEFDERRELPKTVLLERLGGVVATADRTLAELDASTLTEPRRIQGYDVTVLEAIYHVVEHFSMHTGQIILLAKARAGVDLGLWRPPNSRP
jgi:uncharacterized damage-inducible protein DinB